MTHSLTKTLAKARELHTLRHVRAQAALEGATVHMSVCLYGRDIDALTGDGGVYSEPIPEWRKPFEAP